jgi:hypothetical protein
MFAAINTGIRQDDGARALLAHNEADCVNLQPIADTFYCLMAQQLATHQGVALPAL